MLNTYCIGNNIDFLCNMDNESVVLIYIDPPYNTGRNFYNYNDVYEDDVYETMMDKVLSECHRVLSPHGTLIVHVESRITHIFNTLCIRLFGVKNFMNEIIWKTGGNAKNKNKLGRAHDNLLVYAKKASKQVFNPIYFPYDDLYKKNSSVKYCDIHKKEYVTTALYNSQPNVNPRPNLTYEWKGHTKQWYVCKTKMQDLHNNNRLYYNKKNIPRIKRFLDEMEGIPLRDIWTDVHSTQSSEKIDYATQKPVKLLERIITLYSNENDICMDVFAGSGTLGRACINLNRNYILMDINPHGKKVFDLSIQNL